MTQTRRLFGRQGLYDPTPSFEQPRQYPVVTERTEEDGPMSRPAREDHEWKRVHHIDYEKGVMGPKWIEVRTAESLQKEADLEAFLIRSEIEAASEILEPEPETPGPGRRFRDMSLSEILSVGRPDEA